MNADELDPLEEEFTSTLVACDEALAHGIAGAAARVDGTPQELRERLERGVACLRMLGQMWPGPPLPDGEGTLPPDRVLDSFPPAALVTLSRFKIRRELGRGGFGVVFLAFDSQLGREVALKVPRADVLVDPALRRRFQHEAQAAARLDHPNIVPVYDAGEVGSLCFIASAYCPGVTLAAWLQERTEPVSLRVAATLVAATADGVQHAHSRGVLHRDLKPSNVLLVSDGVMGGEDTAQGLSGTTHHSPLTTHRPKITDFGLAKLLTDETGVGPSAGQTRTGAIIGTARYMAPEQAEGKTKEIGTAADVYALGAILYELLTGHFVFEAQSELAILEKIRSQEPIAPSRLKPDLPRDLATICLKCLQKQPSRRYGSAGELAEDLRHWLAGEPVRARPITAWERGWRWVRRRPAVAALIAVTVLAVLAMVGLGVGLWFNGQLQTSLAEAKDQRREADTQRQEAQQQRIRAEQLEQSVRYARDMKLAHQAWQDAHITRVFELLDAWQPGQINQPDPGWEWYYLRGLCRQDLRTFWGAGGSSSALAFSPDGRKLATVSRQTLVKLWEYPSGRELATLRSHSALVTCIAFSSDGQWLASAGADETVKLWDTTTWREATSFHPGQGPLRCVAFSPDGERLASGGELNIVKIWTRNGGGRELELRGHEGWVNCVTFSANGRQLASSGNDGTLRLWDSNTGQEQAVLKDPSDTVGTVVYIPGTSYVAGACGDAAIRVWDTSTKQLIHILQGHTNSINRLAVSPDGKNLASAGDDRMVKLWSVATGQELRTFRGHLDRVLGLAFSPDGSQLASVGYDTHVKVWNPTQEQGVQKLIGHSNHVSSVVFSPDGRSLASASWDRLIKVWDIDRAEEQYSLHGHTREIACVAFNSKGDLLASCGWDTTIRLWDPATKKEVRTLQGSRELVRCVAFAPDGRQLASGSLDGMITIRETETGREMRSFQGHKGEITDLVFSPDGQTLASCGRGDGIKLWNTTTMRLENDFGLKTWMYSLSFSPDGRWLAVGSVSGAISILDMASGKQKSTLKGHATTVYSLAFSPDGRRLASAGADKTVRLWDPASGLETLTLTGHSGEVLSVAFSPDGQHLATGIGYRGLGNLKVYTGSRETTDVIPAGKLGSDVSAHKNGK